VSDAQKPAWRPEKIKEHVARLRRQLAAGSSQPGKDDEPLPVSPTAQPPTAKPSTPQPPTFLSAQDETMLTLLISDGLAGVDITQRYPAFFARLVADPQLTEAFLDALDLLEITAADRAALPPTAATAAALPFLRALQPVPMVRAAGRNLWHVSWRLLRDRLNRDFSSTPELVFRSEQRGLTDKSVVLIEEEVALGEMTLSVMLEAIRPVGEPGWLHLQLLTATPGKDAVPLVAFLHWGRYAARVISDRYGQAVFPPLAIEAIIEGADSPIASDLQLVLEIST
jgi:hypothetical protein